MVKALTGVMIWLGMCGNGAVIIMTRTTIMPLPQKNPQGPETGQQRVIRGGGLLYFGHYARCAARYRVPPYAQSPQIGLRCAKTPEK